MQKKVPLLSLFIIISAGYLISCNSSKEKNTKHYSEEIFQRFEKICEQQKSKNSGFYLTDSLYKTFPYISAADKYRGYDFKRGLLETYRSGKKTYDTAIFYLDSMIAVIKDNHLQKTMRNEYVRAFNIRGEYFTRIERYTDAIRDISQSKQLNQEAGDSCLMGENAKTLGLIAIRQSNYALAADLTKEALLLISSCKKNREQFARMQRYLDDLGFIYGSLKSNDSALLYHFAAMNYVKQNKGLTPDTIFPYEALQNIYGNIGVTYIREKKYAEAELYINKSMAIETDITHNNFSIAQLQYLLGTIYLNTGRIDEAEMMTDKALLVVDKFATGFKVDMFGLRANIAKEKKQYKAEAMYLRQWQAAKDSLYQSRMDLLKNNPFAQYEQLDRSYQEQLLKKDNRNQQNRTNAAIAIGLLVTISALASFYLIWRLRIVMRKRAVVFNQLVASETQLKETMLQKDTAEQQLREKELFAQEMRLQMEFNDAIVQQRNQISDDMHDELSSSLAALKFYAADIKNNMAGTEAEKPLKDITDEIGTVYENARHYMHSLKSNNWETELNLTDFLKEIQQKFSEKGLMNIKLDINEADLKAHLTTHQHDQLYHIVKESIANAIKHSGSIELAIKVSFNNENCSFSIADNGKGFNKEEINYGIGIHSMSNRIKELGGALSISSTTSGSTIAGQFPLVN